MSVIRSGNVVNVGINTYPNTPAGQIITLATGLPKTPISWYGVSLFASGKNGDGFARVNADGSVNVYHVQNAAAGISVSITYITNE